MDVYTVFLTPAVRGFILLLFIIIIITIIIIYYRHYWYEPLDDLKQWRIQDFLYGVNF